MDKIFFKENLNVIIYTIGYHKEGEAILVLVKADNLLRYSIVIDGYKVEEQNILCELLREEEVKNIDMFCWSHPDRDHSVGIEEYIPYINKNTKIVVGDGYAETNDRWKKANNTMYGFIEGELNKSLSKKDRVEVRKVCKGMSIKKLKFVDTRTGIEYPFEVHTFAPSDNLNLRRDIKGMELLNNEISVGMDVKVGALSIAFCADIPNVVFNSITEGEFPEFIDFIKIPHHGSSSSEKVLNLFSNTAEVACSTANVANNLPESDVISQYRNRAKKIFCTNDLEKQKQETTFGFVKTTFCIDRENDVINDLYGNASLVM